ncbi:nucleoside deaminase [Actinoplanes sp. TFC3]|uniref:nucleoside deaminase n=1 Tax=Actinoplanes sp. TFC3 TaxID=1710355 RepID=UPI0008305AD6|nr:nucleoside deaminase [Actinoplanes sp. TFC3]
MTSGDLTATELEHLERAVALAQQARDRGNHPFGAVLVTPDGIILEGLNTVVTGADPTGHAELNLVRQTGKLDATVLAASVMYASTEPCAMCAGSVYWSGVGRLVYALAAEELTAIVADAAGVPPLRLPAREVLGRGDRMVVVDGPVDLASAKAVHEGFWS